MKGLFIPEITAEMFRSGCLESIEALMAEGEIYDIDYPLDQEPCDDCIKREDALMCLTGEWTEPTDEIIHRFIKRIKNLPPVTPQPKMGHWEYVQYDGNPNIGNWHCSECRCIFIEGTIKKEKDSIPFYKYCPQCGAKMEKGSEE